MIQVSRTYVLESLPNLNCLKQNQYIILLHFLAVQTDCSCRDCSYEGKVVGYIAWEGNTYSSPHFLSLSYLSFLQVYHY
ncbi:hypothetical protein VNO77_22368 [Canavalia gladiata]|uniref:Uncharacterized protein n=1 Tax=Canavalia gladiata TaxID=3824 RepID=A0AAN9Q7Y4_CANGL